MKAKVKQMIMMKKPNSAIWDMIAKHLMSKYDFSTIPGKKSNEIYVYDDGVFVEKGKDIIEEECENILEETAKTHCINEIKNKIERLTKVKREDFGCKDKNFICVKNGVLDLNTKILHPHSPTYKFMSKISVEYNPKATCHHAFKFLSEVLNDYDIDCVQEWFGYQLYREYIIKKAVIFRGLPDTGKTTFMNLLIAFIGKENTSSLSLQLISQGKWQVVPLHNKHSNICDDLAPNDIEDSGTFKQITGRSQIRAEIKFGDGFEFENYAKLSFACNKIPIIKSDEDDQAYWNRWMIFDFDNIFNKTNKDTDANIIHKLVTPSQLSGLLNFAIEGLERLLNNGSFSYHKSWIENKKIMLGEASSVAKFNNECLMYDGDNWISNADLWKNYNEFCGLNDITPVSDQKFSKDIRRYCNFGTFNVQKKGGKYGVLHVKCHDTLPIMGI